MALAVWLILGGLLISYLVWDYQGPRVIRLSDSDIFGLSALKGKGLIVQEYSGDGYLIATRGLVVYKLEPGKDYFVKIARVPLGFSIFWLSNFSLVRVLLNKPECLELTVDASKRICAFSSGYMFHYDANNGSQFIKTLKLPHYGIGIGRGIMSTGLLNANDNSIYIGEYFRNEGRTSVNIFQSWDFGRTWNLAYQFAAGQIRHIHAMQKDPYTGTLWVCTGDEDAESMIAFSEDQFKTIQVIGQGSQTWRTCQLVFTEQAIYWGTDTGDGELSGIYRWDKETRETTKLHAVPGAIFFGTKLRNGNLIMSTDRENFPNENDDKARMYILSNTDEVVSIECGQWKNKKQNYKFGFAKTRFQRNQGGPYLAVNFINQKQVESSDLYMIPEAEIDRQVSGN